MARPQKEGLEYFPIVTSFDEKIELIIAEFGPEGLGIIIGLYQRIYTNSYYIFWNEDTLMLFASKYINAEITRVNAVLIRCIDRNIFNKALYDKYKILTSRGIQKQYLKVCKDSRRKTVQFIKEYCLVDDVEFTRVITELISVNTEETPQNDVQSTQRKEKEKESKEKESKEKETLSPPEVNSHDNEAIEIVKYYETLKPGQFISTEMATLKIWLEKYKFDWVKEAIQMSVTNKGKFIKPWIEKVLENWTAEGKSPPVIKKVDTFNNYEQRTYDYNDLEKNLLNGKEEIKESVDSKTLMEELKNKTKNKEE